MLYAKILTIFFGLQSAIQTIVAHKIEELKDESGTFKIGIQVARKEGDTYRACLPKPIETREVLYAVPHKKEDDDDLLMIYKKKMRPFKSEYLEKRSTAPKNSQC